MALNERDFFVEKPETRSMSLACPQCRHRADYQIKWVRRTKKDRLPGGADERDRAKFAKITDHLYRVDDFAVCVRCRRRFEIPSHQSIIRIGEDLGLPKDVEDDE
jgi:DNA-directed RNA polymerase subunit RPC12/RpoP